MRAQETAFQLIAAVDRGSVVQNFLRRYAAEQDRPGRIRDAARFRDLVDAIRREAFLAMCLRLQEEASRRFRLRRGPRRTDEVAHRDLAKLFWDEFYVALGRGLDYSREEFEKFHRDLELYRTLSRNASGPHHTKMPSLKGPFVDRCGFLLDSPMLEQGRLAAGQLQLQLNALASAVLQKVFARREG